MLYASIPICVFRVLIFIFFLFKNTKKKKKQILMNALAVRVRMAELVLTLLVDFVVNAYQNGPVTYAKWVSEKMYSPFFSLFRKTNSNFVY